MSLSKDMIRKRKKREYFEKPSHNEFFVLNFIKLFNNMIENIMCSLQGPKLTDKAQEILNLLLKLFSSIKSHELKPILDKIPNFNENIDKLLTLFQPKNRISLIEILFQAQRFSINVEFDECL